jgi:hypothetical protein
MPQHDDSDDLSALDFSSYASESDDDADSHALDFSVDEEIDDEDDVEALYEYAPAEAEEAGTELDAIASATEAADEDDEDDEDEVGLFTVTNPPETVSVSSIIDGRTQRVRLSPKVNSMTESELTEEILVLAGLAKQKGLAGQHNLLLEDDALHENMRELGLEDNEFLNEMIDNVMHLPTQEEADAAQAEVFSTRYTADK